MLSDIRAEVPRARLLATYTEQPSTSTLQRYWPSEGSSDAPDMTVYRPPVEAETARREPLSFEGEAYARILKTSAATVNLGRKLLVGFKPLTVSVRYVPLASVGTIPIRLAAISVSRLSDLISESCATNLPSSVAEIKFSDWKWEGYGLPHLEEEFKSLVAQWRESRGPTSSLTKMFLDPTYQRIIGMGKAVVPLLLREMEQRPDHWDWALRAITGADPTKAEDEGDLERIAARWVEWGKEQGLRW